MKYKYGNYKHFNMLSINNAFKILGSYVYKESTDLKDAFAFYTYTFYGSQISKIYILLFISIISYMSNGYGHAIRVLKYLKYNLGI